MKHMDLIFGTGASSKKDYEGLFSLIGSCIDNGIICFDTAPSYHTEPIVGEAIHKYIQTGKIKREDVSLQTKIDPLQMQNGTDSVRHCIEQALKTLDCDYIDTLLIHWPVTAFYEDTWKAFVRAKEEKLVNRIGVCNVRARHIQKLKDLDMVPDVVQIERNPLRTCYPEIGLCKEAGIEVQGYSPLCKMHPKIRNSKDILEIAQKYDLSVGQTVMKWHIQTGVIPVFTSTKSERIKEYAQVKDVVFSEEDIEKIDQINENYKVYLESPTCPGF